MGCLETPELILKNGCAVPFVKGAAFSLRAARLVVRVNVFEKYQAK